MKDVAATRMIYESDLCTVCGRGRGIAHAERQHRFAFRRGYVLRRRRSMAIIAGAMAVLDAHGTPVSDHARMTYQRLSRAKRGT